MGREESRGPVAPMIGVAEEVGKVAAEEREHEAHGDLGLAQGDAGEGEQQRDERRR